MFLELDNRYFRVLLDKILVIFKTIQALPLQQKFIFQILLKDDGYRKYVQIGRQDKLIDENYAYFGHIDGQL